MNRFYVLVGLVVLFIVCGAVLIGSVLLPKKRRRRIESAFENAYEGDQDSCEPKVKAMISLYLTMVAKHGPASEEAKAFRFGTDSDLIRRLHEDDGSLKIFNEQADIIDDVARRILKRR